VTGDGSNETTTGSQYTGFVYVTTIGKLFGAPGTATNVLIVDPTTNTSDTIAISGLGSNPGKWRGFASAPGTVVEHLLYAAPGNENSVLVVDPTSNSSEVLAVPGLAPITDAANTAGHCYGFTFSPIDSRFYGSPGNASAVLILDPVTLRVDSTTLDHMDPPNRRWSQFTFVPSTSALYAVPVDATTVLTVGRAVNRRVLAPMRNVPHLARRIQLLNATLSSTQSQLTSVEMQLVAAQDGLLTINANLTATETRTSTMHAEMVRTNNVVTSTRSEAVAALSTLSAETCIQPECGASTRVQNGKCIPDCSPP
jgi:hypothetical protein